MNTIPEQDPFSQEPPTAPTGDASPSAELNLASLSSVQDQPSPETGSPAEPPLFQSFIQPETLAPPRIPHFGHLCLLAALTSVALIAVGLLTRSALYFHLFGVSSLKQAITDIHYTLGTMAALYVFTFGLAVFVFPLFWHKSFLDGLQWRAQTALHLRRRLFSAAILCFVLALINGFLMPGPQDTPIDKIFRAPGAAWLMFAFGITFAPFFEEIVFRGFLLPSLCTAYDWTAERFSGDPSLATDENGHPQWSVMAMFFGSLLTSIPFAWMHAEQTGYAAGPLLLLVCVSLVLCWARLSTRSLAASVLVHACYNFLLFSIMLIGTSGFRHLDKM